MLVEGAEGSLEGFLADAETVTDVVGRGGVGEGQTASGRFTEGIEEVVGEITETAFTDALDGEVHLAVRTYLDNGHVEHVTCVGGLGLEDLVIVEQTGTAVVGNHLEAQRRLLLHDGFEFLSAVVLKGCGGLEIALHFGRGHDALRLVVDVDMHQIGTSLLHGHLLLAEGHKEVLHQAPVEKGSEFVDPCHTEKGKIADTGQRGLHGSDEAFALVEIDEHVDFRAGTHLGFHVGFGHEDFADFASVEVGAVVGEARDAQGIVVSEFDHRDGERGEFGLFRRFLRVNDFSVDEMDGAVGQRGELFVVGHDDKRLTHFVAQAEEKAMELLLVVGVERA